MGSKTRALCGQYTNASQITVPGATVNIMFHIFPYFWCRCCCRNHNHCQPFRPPPPQTLLQRQFSRSATSLAPPATMCGWGKTAGCLALPSILFLRLRLPSSPLMAGFFCSLRRVRPPLLWVCLLCCHVCHTPLSQSECVLLSPSKTGRISSLW